MEKLNFFEHLLEERASDRFDQVAYRFLPNDRDELILTNGELLIEARKLAGVIRKNISPGQRVLLIYPAGIEFIKAFYACILARVVAVPLPAPKASEIDSRLKHVLLDCDPAAIFTDNKLFELVCSQLTDEYRKVVVATDSLLDEIRTVPSRSIADEDVTLLQYTSGSTSKPKGVILRSKNLLANLKQIESAFGHTRESVGVIWLPHYHDMGLIGGILQPLFVGFPVTLLAPIAFIQRPLRWLNAIHKYRATTSGGPNFSYDLCVEKMRSTEIDLDLSCWNLAFNGAEAIKMSTLDSFSSTFARHGFSRKAFVPCYGLAEATLLVSSVPNDEIPKFIESSDIRIKTTGLAVPARENIVSSGRVAPGVNVQVLHPNSMAHCKPGEIGELVVQGEGVASGYWSKNDLAFSSTEPASFRTGDLGFQLEGELFVTGRISDLIVIRGRNLFPEDIEETMRLAEPSLALDGVVAFSVNGDATEELILLQEFNSRSVRNLNVAAVRDTISSLVMQKHGVGVSGFVPVRAGSLARTSSGKISRFACKQLYLSKNLQQLPL